MFVLLLFLIGFCFCFVFVFVLFSFMFSCSRWSFVNVLTIFSCPADHIPDWQRRILLGMAEARSVTVKNIYWKEYVGVEAGTVVVNPLCYQEKGNYV